jgi:hypothetical protein
MTTGEQEHTRGDPPCTPVVPPLLPTCSLGPSDPLTTQPSTHTQLLTQWLKTTCHDTTTPAIWDTKAECSSHIPQAKTATTDPCHHLATQLATHIQPLPQQLKTACHNATTNTEQPVLPHHFMQCGGPTHAQSTPPLAHGTSHRPKHLPG